MRGLPYQVKPGRGVGGTRANHGIALYGAVDCQVVNNTAVDLNPTRRSTWVMITAHKDGTLPVGCVMRNNLATVISGPSQVARDRNLVVSNYYDHFVDFSS